LDKVFDSAVRAHLYLWVQDAKSRTNRLWHCNTACARVHFSGCSSTTNARSETGQMTVCCQNLTLGALSSRSALTVLVGALFKKFGLFLNTPRIKFIQQLCIQPEDGLQSRNMSLLIIKVVPRLVILYSFIKRKRSVPYMWRHC